MKLFSFASSQAETPSKSRQVTQFVLEKKKKTNTQKSLRVGPFVHPEDNPQVSRSFSETSQPFQQGLFAPIRPQS